MHYLVANAASLAIGIVLFYPRVRLRWQPRLYLRRWADSVTVAGAEVLFYVQSEFDKIVVLAVGGPAVSGLYAIMMRLADLTALPVRSFNTLLVQRIMRAPQTIASWRTRLLIEACVFTVSLAAIASMAIYLHIFPAGLGRNVAEASPYIALICSFPPFAIWWSTSPNCSTRPDAPRGGPSTRLCRRRQDRASRPAAGGDDRCRRLGAGAERSLCRGLRPLLRLTYAALRHPVRRVI